MKSNVGAANCLREPGMKLGLNLISPALITLRLSHWSLIIVWQACSRSFSTTI